MTTLIAETHQAAHAPWLISAAEPRPSVSQRPVARFMMAGGSGDGKSTLIGRVLNDANNRFSIADAPGQRQGAREIAAAATTADAAIVLVDARHGLTAECRRHAYVAWLMGIRRMAIVVNKMDLVGYDREVFDRIQSAWDALAAWLPGVHFDVLPVSALLGDNVATRSAQMPWFTGPSLLDVLEAIDARAWDADAPLRIAIQCVIRHDLEFHGYAGRVDSGRLRVGQHIQALPSGKQSRVKRIVTPDGDIDEAFAPMAVTLALEDELDISRGEWICGLGASPTVASQFEATLVWMHEHALGAGEQLLLQQGAARVPVFVREIVRRMEPVTNRADPSSRLALNEIGLVRLETGRPLAVDRFSANHQTGSFILIDPIDNHTLAAGMVERVVGAASTSQPPNEYPAAVTAAERRQRHGHGSAIVCSPSARVLFGLQRALFERGASAAVVGELPPRTLLRDLMANGLILLSPPPAGTADLDGLLFLEAASGCSPNESVRAVLSELERRGVLAARDLVGPGEGI